MKKALIIILNCALALVIVSVAAFSFLPRLGVNSGLKIPFEMKIVRSGSMEPDIPTGSLVVIQPSHVYRIGDVITFGPDTPTSVPTSHRIISERDADGTTYYTTKGDANNAADEGEVAKDKVIGRITFSLPYAGYVLAFSKTKNGFFMLVVIPASLVILCELIGIAKEVQTLRRRNREEKSIAVLAEKSLTPAPLSLRRTYAPAQNSRRLHFDIEEPARGENRILL
jgi:signal peptidase